MKWENCFGLQKNPPFSTTTHWVQRAERWCLVYYTWRKFTLLKQVRYQKKNQTTAHQVLLEHTWQYYNIYYRLFSIINGQLCGNKWQKPVEPLLSKMLNFLPSYFCFSVSTYCSTTPKQLLHNSSRSKTPAYTCKSAKHHSFKLQNDIQPKKSTICATHTNSKNHI